jgi:hypothetical protein
MPRGSTGACRIAIRLGVEALVANLGGGAECLLRLVTCDLRGAGVELGGLLVGHAADSIENGRRGARVTPFRLSAAERRQSSAHLPDQLGVPNGAEAEKRTVVLDRRRGVTALIGNDREVVV